MKDFRFIGEAQKAKEVTAASARELTDELTSEEGI